MQQPSSPWYKHFWPWVVFGLPLASVTASLITVYVAARSPHAMVVDDYYKQGLAINQDIGRDRRAAELGLEAKLVLHERRAELSLTGAAPDKPLVLKLIHPTFAGQDLVLSLRPLGGGLYETPLPVLTPARWHVQVLAPDRSWRLTGRIDVPHQRQLDMTPAA